MTKATFIAIPNFTNARLVLSALVLSVFTLVPTLGKSQETVVSHGYNFFGELKYPSDFAHLDYVNPNALGFT